MVSGPDGKRPNTKVRGETPVVQFTASRKAHEVQGMYLCHWLLKSTANFPIIALTLPTQRSTNPVELPLKFSGQVTSEIFS